MPLEILEVHFDCSGSQNLVGWRGCLSCALSLWQVVTFCGRRTGNLMTFCDRCKGSERCYFEVQILWQAPHVGHLSRSLTLTLALTLTHSHSLSVTLTLTLTHSHSVSLTHSQSLTHSHSHSHTHSQQVTYSPPPPPSPRSPPITSLHPNPSRLVFCCHTSRPHCLGSFAGITNFFMRISDSDPRRSVPPEELAPP